MPGGQYKLQPVDTGLARDPDDKLIISPTPVQVVPPPSYITEYVIIPCHTADALDANDAMGDKFTIRVPVSGIILSASLLDRDDEGSQIDIAIFTGNFTAVAGDAAFSLSDVDAEKKIMELKFTTFDDNVNNQTSSLENIGKDYRLVDDPLNIDTGLMYAQAITRATPTIAAGSEPKIRLEILPDRPS